MNKFCCARLLFAISLVLSITGAPTTSEAVYSWNSATASEPKYFRSTGQSMLLDQAGRQHIFYGGSHLFHAFFDGVQWQKVTIDNSPQVGRNAAASIDVNGNFHIIYQDAFNSKYKYITNKTGFWVFQTLPLIQPDIIVQPAISVDSTGFVHIAYAVNDGTLSYITNKSGTWVNSTLGTTNHGTGFFNLGISIAVDNNGKVHATYQRWFPSPGPNGRQLVYVTGTAGAWSYTVLETSIYLPSYENSSMRLDASNKVHVAYLGNDLNLRYVTNVSGNWVTEIVDNSPGQELYPSLAIDGNGKIHISYMQWTQIPGSNEEVRYANNINGTWSIYVDGVRWGAGGATSLALDASSFVHIAYHDTTNKALKYLTNKGGWSTLLIDSSLEKNAQQFKGPIQYNRTGLHSDMVIDRNGKHHLSYIKENFGKANGYLIYATDKSGIWVETQVYGGFPSFANQSDIAIDQFGFAHIVFYTDTREIHYATNSSGVWVTQLIEQTDDQQGIVKPSIHIDSTGAAHVSYYKGSWWFSGGSVDVRYASNATGAWQMETIQTVGSFAMWSGGSNNETLFVSDINLDTSGAPVVAFLNNNRDVVYARRAGGVWTPAIIAANNSFFPRNQAALLITKQGKVHMAYRRFGCSVGGLCFDNGLGYGTNSTGAWVDEVVNDNVYLIYNPFLELTRLTNPSIALDLSGNIHISYMHNLYQGYRVTQRSLRYSRKVGAIWRNSIAIHTMKATTSSDSFIGQSHSVAISPGGIPAISYYDAENESMNLALSTQIASPMINIFNTPNSTYLGSVKIGSTSSRAVTISNLGNTPLNITNITLTNQKGAGFSLDLMGGASPCTLTGFTLSPAAACTFTMAFSPSQYGNASAAVRVNSNDPQLPSLMDTFTAFGTTTIVPPPASTATEGGCVIMPSSAFDPTFLVLLLLASMMFIRREMLPDN